MKEAKKTIAVIKNGLSEKELEESSKRFIAHKGPFKSRTDLINQLKGEQVPA